jgi:hypothetical protein
MEISNPRTLNYPLGSIGKSLKELSELWGEEIPQIQCLVVNRSTGLPGEGIAPFIGDAKRFAMLNAMQKRARIGAILERIFTYDKWESVLDALELRPTHISGSVKKLVREASSTKRGARGEGELHKKLKEYVKNHPESIGVKLKGLKSEIERGLPSGDSIDVFFENKTHWIGVEVKSEISDVADILRGLYQCVKYQAVMESCLSVLNSRRDAKVILALGSGLPISLVSLRNTLGIEVVENVDAK